MSTVKRKYIIANAAAFTGVFIMLLFAADFSKIKTTADTFQLLLALVVISLIFIAAINLAVLLITVSHIAANRVYYLLLKKYVFSQNPNGGKPK